MPLHMSYCMVLKVYFGHHHWQMSDSSLPRLHIDKYSIKLPMENITFLGNKAQRGGALFIDQKSSSFPILGKINTAAAMETIERFGLKSSCPIFLNELLATKEVSAGECFRFFSLLSCNAGEVFFLVFLCNFLHLSVLSSLKCLSRLYPCYYWLSMTTTKRRTCTSMTRTVFPSRIPPSKVHFVR